MTKKPTKTVKAKRLKDKKRKPKRTEKPKRASARAKTKPAAKRARVQTVKKRPEKKVKDRAKKAVPKPKKAVTSKKQALVAPPKKRIVSTKPVIPAEKPVTTAPRVAAPVVSEEKPAAILSPATSVPASAEAARGGRARLVSREFLIELAGTIREAISPAVHAARGREVVGTASSGDATFALDAVAEKALLAFLKSARMPVAYYSEDAGYTTFTSGQPQALLVVDPIDGTRAAKSGFESCVISVASTRVIERPRLADVDHGCVMEILGNRVFYAERGKGARVYVDGHFRKAKLSTNDDLESISWAMTVPARPAELIFPTVAKLIDTSSLKGGFFACNSTSYSLTRLLTNQLDACMDFANRYYRDIPGLVADYFINAGRGTILGIAPYDIAASLLIAQEAGCIVADAYGSTLDEVLLLDSSVGNHRSMVAAANRDLYDKLMRFLSIRIPQFEELLRKRRLQSNAQSSSG